MPIRFRTIGSRLACIVAATGLACIVAAPGAYAENVDAVDERLSLEGFVRQALAVNLDLAAQRDALAASREQVDIARSPLLPQLSIGANAQHLEDDRSDDNRGTITQRSATVQADASQLLYDEDSWAGYRIQEHVYAGQQDDFESFRLGLIQRAAVAFLNLELSRNVVAIQRKNREITRQNVETTRARIATGYSSEREVLRWESQLAGNDQDVSNARAQTFADLFELNAIRNRPLETAVATLPAGEAEYGFLYSRDEIVRAIETPELDRKFRDAVVAFGLDRSPVLAAINESIQAEKRRLTANRRSFWVPTVSLDAGVNHLTADDAKTNDADFDDTEWTVGVGLTLPLFAGGSRIAEVRQTTQQLSSFQLQYDANALTISQGIRSALAGSSAAFVNIASARKQRDAAQKNYDLVDRSYESGVATILSLLDAQAQLLSAELALKNARYDFLTALVSVEQQIAFYPFLESKAEVGRFLDDLVAGLRS
jgi:outer membrane protein TolC